MRTRIALVATVPVAVITVSTFTQTATAQSAPTTTTAHTVPPRMNMRFPTPLLTWLAVRSCRRRCDAHHRSSR